MSALFIILVGLTLTLSNEKNLISTRCISGFMSNLIKKSCKDSSQYPLITLLETSKSESQRRRWISRINRKDLVPNRNTTICSLHFKDEDFVPDEKNLDSRRRKLKARNLRPNVVPSLLMGYDISGTYFTLSSPSIKTCVGIFLWNRTYSTSSSLCVSRVLKFEIAIFLQSPLLVDMKKHCRMLVRLFLAISIL